MVLNDGAAEVVALWVLHTHAIDASVISPRLAITSVVMRSGKTTLVDVLSQLVRRPVTTVNATAVAIFQSRPTRIQPTLLIDEADTLLARGALSFAASSIPAIAATLPLSCAPMQSTRLGHRLPSR